MKVKLLKSIWCSEGSFEAGQEPDLSESTAKGLIAGGYAEEITIVKPIAKKEIEPEIAPETKPIKKETRRKQV